MKKSRILAAAMASIVLTGALVSCGEDKKEDGEKFESEINMNECVYGPPPAYEDASSENEADSEALYETSSGEGDEAAASQEN